MVEHLGEYIFRVFVTQVAVCDLNNVRQDNPSLDPVKISHKTSCCADTLYMVFMGSYKIDCFRLLFVHLFLYVVKNMWLYISLYQKLVIETSRFFNNLIDANSTCEDQISDMFGSVYPVFTQVQ